VWHTIFAGEPIDVPERTNLGSVTVIEIHAAAPPSFPYAYPTVKKSVTTVCGGREGRGAITGTNITTGEVLDEWEVGPQPGQRPLN
jgi:hypothetical protein